MPSLLTFAVVLWLMSSFAARPYSQEKAAPREYQGENALEMIMGADMNGFEVAERNEKFFLSASRVTDPKLITMVEARLI